MTPLWLDWIALMACAFCCGWTCGRMGVRVVVVVRAAGNEERTR